VSEALPFISIIVAARPEQESVPSADAALRLDYPAQSFEILIARGRHPSVQRNEAVRMAQGDLIYFLDDDAIPDSENLRRVAPYFRDPGVVILGGPNLCPEEAPQIEQWFSRTMGSWLAFSSSSARYARKGAVRDSGEKELILCNLIFRKSTFLDHGGFDEFLYPNEENALMDEIQRDGGRLLYDPDFFVLRRPRPTLSAFSRMLLTYGRGRAEQFRLHPSFGSLLNWVPPFFVVFLFLLFFLPPTFLILPGIYLATILFQAWRTAPASRRWWMFPIAGLIFLTHFLYGLGFWRGLFRKMSKGTVESARVRVEKVYP